MDAATPPQLLAPFALPAGHRRLARRIHADVVAFFRGEQGGFHPCAAPYTNLDHTLAVVRAAGCLVAGCRKNGGVPLDADSALAVFAAACLHDIGMLRRGAEEAAVAEGAFTFRHIGRGLAFARRYLADLGCDRTLVDTVAAAIAATGLYREPGVADTPPPAAIPVAGIVVSADHLAQAAHPDILAAMAALWEELRQAYDRESAAYLEKVGAPRFASYQDLLLDILRFYDTTMVPRLAAAGGFDRYLADHFGTADHPFQRAVQANYQRLAGNRTILMGVVKHLLAADRLVTLQNHALAHLRRALMVDTLVVGAGELVVVSGRHDCRALVAAMEESGVEGVARRLAGPLVLQRLADAQAAGAGGLPASWLAAVYPLLHQATVVFRSLAEDGTRGLAVGVLDRSGGGGDNHALELLADLGPVLCRALASVAAAGRRRDPLHRLRDLLASRGLVDEETFGRAVAKARRDHLPLPLALERLAGVEQEVVARAVARVTGYPFVVPAGLAGGGPPGRGPSAKFCRRHFLAVLGPAEDHTLRVVCADPLLQDIPLLLRGVLRQEEVSLAVATPAAILRHLEEVQAGTQGPLSLLRPGELDALGSGEELAEPLPDFEVASPAVEEHLVVRLASQILADAVSAGASDIHVEYRPRRNDGQVRLRVDGCLRRHLRLQPGLLKPLVARYKIMAGLDIAEKRLPQDGGFRVTLQGRRLDWRLVTLPRAGGIEEVVLRLLAGNRTTPIDPGFSPANEAAWRRVLRCRHGLILVSGPTGSGKTTTIHDALRRMRRDDLKVWTVEDPVEIVQDGISQVPVNPGRGLGFAGALKAVLRADPDVIFVGEVRDEATAVTAVRAALTGHLVFTTLHSDNALAALLRLGHYPGVTGLDLAEGLRCSLAQRLVRRLCPHCRVAVEPAPEEAAAGDATPPAPRYRPTVNGCGACHGSGYRGRIPLHELFVPAEEDRPLIRALDLDALRHRLRQRHWQDMAADGRWKAAQGLVAAEALWEAPLDRPAAKTL